MIRKAAARILKFKRDENGNITVEFVILFPLFMFFFVSAAEYSLITLQQASLERAMDITVRDIRLGTGSGFDHDDIKDALCDRSVLLRNCKQSLRLEMIIQDPFAGLNISREPICIEKEEESKPVIEFQQGLENDLMVLRACAKVIPVFPTSAMARSAVDDDGTIRLTATTAFVQEPG